MLIVATAEWTMRKTTKSPRENIFKDIKRAGRDHYSSEEKIGNVLDGPRSEDSIAELCLREGISQGIHYKWSKDFMEAVKKRLAGATTGAANTDDFCCLVIGISPRQANREPLSRPPNPSRKTRPPLTLMNDR